MKTLRHKSIFQLYNILFTFGAAPLYTIFNSKLYAAYSLIGMLIAPSAIISNAMIIYVHSNEMELALQDSLAIFVLMNGLWTQLYLRLRKDAVFNLLAATDSFTWDENPIRDPSTGNMTMTGWISVMNRISRNILICVWGYFIICQGVLQVLIFENPPLLIPGWFPFDTTTSSLGYAIAIMFQLFSSMVLSNFVYGFPPFYATLICIAGSQLEKLRRNMSLLKDDAEQLKTYIRNHQQILEYMNLIEETFSPLMLMSFLMLTMSLCVASFSAAMIEDFFPFLRSIVVYLVTLLNVFAFCWFGDELTEEAYKVGEAAYGMDWTELPQPFKRSVMLVIAGANKTFSLTAGKILPVNREVMKNMIEKSISLFMFLMNVKDLE